MSRSLESNPAAERAASDAFVAEHISRFHRYAMRRRLSSEDADDVVVKALLRAWGSRVRWMRLDPGAQRGYVWTILKNEVRRFQREKQRRAGLLEDLAGEEWAALPDSAPGPEERVLARECSAEVLDALRTLSPADRQLLEWWFFEDMSSDEIAVRLGCTPGAVRVRVHRALGKLRKILTTAGGKR